MTATPRRLGAVNGTSLTSQDGKVVGELAGLRLRLETLPVIEQSKGILIGYYGIDEDAAFQILRGWSSRTNIKIRQISADSSSGPPRQGQPPSQIPAWRQRSSSGA